MIPIDSNLENKTFSLYELEEKLKPLGYSIGGNWDYDHGSFDFQMDDKVSYQFVRLPFQAIEGQLDDKGTVVSLGTPYLLAHKYQRGLDDHVHLGNFKAAFDQFQEPQDPDASIPEEFEEQGRQLVKKLEDTLLT